MANYDYMDAFMGALGDWVPGQEQAIIGAGSSLYDSGYRVPDWGEAGRNLFADLWQKDFGYGNLGSLYGALGGTGNWGNVAGGWGIQPQGGAIPGLKDLTLDQRYSIQGGYLDPSTIMGNSADWNMGSRNFFSTWMPQYQPGARFGAAAAPQPPSYSPEQTQQAAANWGVQQSNLYQPTDATQYMPAGQRDLTIYHPNYVAPTPYVPPGPGPVSQPIVPEINTNPWMPWEQAIVDARMDDAAAAADAAAGDGSEPEPDLDTTWTSPDDLLEPQIMGANGIYQSILDMLTGKAPVPYLADILSQYDAESQRSGGGLEQSLALRGLSSSSIADEERRLENTARSGGRAAASMAGLSSVVTPMLGAAQGIYGDVTGDRERSLNEFFKFMLAQEGFDTQDLTSSTAALGTLLQALGLSSAPVSAGSGSVANQAAPDNSLWSALGGIGGNLGSAILLKMLFPA